MELVWDERQDRTRVCTTLNNQSSETYPNSDTSALPSWRWLEVVDPDGEEIATPDGQSLGTHLGLASDLAQNLALSNTRRQKIART